MSSDYILNQKYTDIDDLVEQFGKNLIKLDLGCGYYKPVGYVGIDNGMGFDAQIENKENFPDILMDLDRKALPFADNFCVEVRASHFLEHSTDAMHVMAEIFRVVNKPDGRFVLILPYANSAPGMYAGHLVFYTEKWFYENIWFQEHWEIRNEFYTPSDYWNKSPWIFRKIIPFDLARIFLFNACDQMELHCFPKKAN